MGTRCERCTHFRPKRQLEELLKLTTDRPSSALDDIRKSQQQWEEDESQTLLDLLIAGDKTWPGRSPPRILPYCGLEEQQRKYLVHESKDAGERCKDFVSRAETPYASCWKCAHRREARGPKRDLEERRDYGWFYDNETSYSGKNYSPDYDGLKRVRHSLEERIAERISAAMLQALHSNGEMDTVPEYYDYCGKFSKAGAYVLCRVFNYHFRCPGYSPEHGDIDDEHQGRDAPQHRRLPDHADAGAGTKRPSRPRRWRDGGGF
jgi:hypothetical protein